MKTKTLHSLILTILLVGLAIPTQTARAATTWEVRSTDDGAPVPANCPGAGCRLRDAVSAAAPGDTIQFHLPIPSTITLTNGEINLEDDLTLSGMGSTKLTIDGNNAARIFYISNNANVSITGMKLTHGRAIDAHGGAIFNQDGTVSLDDLIVTQNIVDSGGGHGGGGIFSFDAMTITNSQITDNSAPLGGGIYSSYGSALNMTNVTVSGNQTTAVIGAGGGITLISQPNFPSSMNLDGVVVSGNTATGSAGGVEIGSDAVVSIKNSSISGNIAQAGAGGGLFIYSNANITVETSTFNGNQSTEDGGGIWLTGAALTMTDSTVSVNMAGNTSNDEGGGIMSLASSTLSLSRVTINGNSAGRGGGLSSYGAATLTNVTVSGNSASVQTGGFDNFGTASLNHVTVAGNSAVNHTGGIETNGSGVTKFRNSIVADNTAPSSADCSGNFNSQGYNLIEDDDPLNCFITGDTATNLTGLDPLLDSLLDNGGSTLTMNLLAASPAIDSADNATCAPEDQRNFLRGQDGNGDDVNECDMGAVEYAPYPVPYSISRADPNPTSAAQVDYTVKFSEPVSNVDIGDFDITNITGNITGASLNTVTGSGLEYTVTVDTGSGNGTLQLELIDDDSILSGFTGDPLGGAGAGNGGALGEIYTIEKTPPSVTSITRANPDPTSAASVDFTVTFSEPVTGVDTADFSLTTTGVSDATVSGVSGSGATRTLTVNTGGGNGTIRLDLKASSTGIVDALNNPISGGFTGGETYTVQKDIVAPTILSITRTNPNPTALASVNFAVIFSESVTGVDAADFSLTTTGVSGATVSGVSGSGATRTVTVHTGSGNGTIRLNLKASGTGIVDALSNPISGGFTGGQVYNINKTLTFKSIGANDGWIFESTETSNKGGSLNSSATTFRLGDFTGDKQYRAILHFDTSALPDNAVITKVTLKIKQSGMPVGSNPFTILNALKVDIRRPRFGSSAALVNSDFQAAASQANIGNIPNTAVANWYTRIWTSGAFFSSINKTGSTQFRLYFAKDDNDDNGADYMKFFSGNAPAGSRPQLIVEYYVP